MKYIIAVSVVSILIFICGAYIVLERSVVRNHDNLLDSYTPSDTYTGSVVLTQKTEIGDGKAILTTGNVTINADQGLTINGALGCTNGSITIIAKEFLDINNLIICESYTDGNITIVAENGFSFGPNARIISNGNVQIVDDMSLMLSAEKLTRRYFDIAQQSTALHSIGPLFFEEIPVSTEPKQNMTPNEVPETDEPLSIFRRIIPKVYAQHTSSTIQSKKPPVIISGEIILKSALRNSNQLLYIHMPNTESLTLKDVQIKTPDGRNGVADFGRCSTKGGAGLDAANILISSHSLVIDDSTITLGSGGRGGDATVDNSCIATLAEGGDGGNPGNFLIESSSGIEIRNTLLITSGSGGDGGHANAIGIRASETTDGGSASAIAGSGNNLRVKPDPFNNVDNTDMIEISNVTGGNGGNASAVGGEGYIDQDCSTRNNSNGTAVAAFGTGGTITLSNEDTEPFFTIVNGADGIAVAEDGSFNNSTCIPANEAGSSTAPAQDTESPVL